MALDVTLHEAFCSVDESMWLREECRINLTKVFVCSCGLWLLFHSLSVRVSDSESKDSFLAIRGFVDHFFKCQECREHFLEMSSRYRLLSSDS
jgi:hypothetical protein